VENNKTARANPRHTLQPARGCFWRRPEAGAYAPALASAENGILMCTPLLRKKIMVLYIFPNEITVLSLRDIKKKERRIITRQ
jgi:phosphatidylserine/phosphatidylglycerophosphate/cardiolipin synthase-like enzyme